MVTKEAILDDLELKRLFSFFKLFYNLIESVYVWSYAFFRSLHDTTKCGYRNKLYFLHGKMHGKSITKMCPWFYENVRKKFGP